MHLSRLAFLSVIRNDPKSCLPALGVIMSIKDLLCQIEVWSSKLTNINEVDYLDIVVTLNPFLRVLTREELVSLSWSVCLRVFTEQLFFGLCSKTDKYAHSKGWWWLTAAGLSSLLIPLVKPMDFEIELNWQTLSVLKMSPSLHISLSVKNKTKQTNRDINCSFSHY